MFALSFLSTLVAVASAVQWPRFGYDSSHTGLSPAAGPGSTPSLVWAKTQYSSLSGSHVSSPVIDSDGNVYIGTLYSAGMGGFLEKWSPSGDLVWSTYLGGYGMLPTLSETLGYVFIGATVPSTSGKLKAFSMSTGAEIWSYTCSPHGSEMEVYSAPLMSPDNTMVYFGSLNRYFSALSATTGSLIWSTAAGQKFGAHPVLGTNGYVLSGCIDGYMYAFHPTTGAVQWYYHTSSWVWGGAAVSSNGNIHFGSYDNYLYSVSSSGNLNWRYPTGSWIDSTPAINGQLVYFGGGDSYMYALNMDTGALVWKTLTGGAIESSPCVGSDGIVYVGSNDGKLYAFNGATGAIIFSYNIGSGVESSPAIASDGALYVAANDNKLYKLKVPTPPSVRYIRMTKSSSYIGLQEFKAITSTGVNVALNCAVTSVVPFVWGSASMCVDGIYSVTDSSYNAMIGYSTTEWIEFDLGAAYTTLASVVVVPTSQPYGTNNDYYYYAPGDTLVFMDGSRNVLSSASLPMSWYNVADYSVSLSSLTFAFPTPSGTPAATTSPGATTSPAASVTSASTPLPAGPVPSFTMNTVAGSGSEGYSGNGGAATSAMLAQPHGVLATPSGDFYVADTINSVIRFVSGSTGLISTYAGTYASGGTGHSFADAGSHGDGGLAVNAQLYWPSGLAQDASSNVYIAEGNVVRVVSAATRIISTFAGTGSYGFSGDNGAATSATMYLPISLAFGATGILYISDSQNHRIRAVSATSHIISTVVGTGTAGLYGDNGAATSAQLNQPNGITVVGGVLYIADYNNDRIRSVKLSTSIITTIAGSGQTGYVPGYNYNLGDGGLATEATLKLPNSVAVDAAGHVFIGDGDNTIRYVNTNGIISTVAGTLYYGFVGGDNVPATSATLSYVYGMSIASDGGVLFADLYGQRIRKLVPPPTSTPTSSLTPSSSPSSSATSSPSHTANYRAPLPVRYVRMEASTRPGSSDSYYYMNMQEMQIWDKTGTNAAAHCSISFSGTFIWGSAAGFNDGLFDPATLSEAYENMLYSSSDGPKWVEFDLGSELLLAMLTIYPSSYAYASNSWGDNYRPGGKLTFMDASRNIVLLYTLPAGESFWDGVPSLSINLTPLLMQPATSSPSPSNPASRSATLSPFYTPSPVPVFLITTAAGNGYQAPIANGYLATTSQLNYPASAYATLAGDLFIADSANNAVRYVNATTGILNAFAGTGTAYDWNTVTPAGLGDGGLAVNAKLYYPRCITQDTAGNVYISELAGRVRVVFAATGIIQTVTGTGIQGYSGDGDAATNAQVNNPWGLAIRPTSGVLYLADYGNHRVRAVSPSGIITTVAGTGEQSFSGDGGQAMAATMWNPAGLAQANDVLYICDSNNNRVRSVSLLTGVIQTVVGSGGTGYQSLLGLSIGDNGPATSATLNGPLSVTLDSDLNMYIADSSSQIVRFVRAVVGIITTIAGQRGIYMFGGDGVFATSSSFYSPMSVSLDGQGGVYIADPNTQRIRKLGPCMGAACTVTSSLTSSRSMTQTPSNPPTVTSTRTPSPTRSVNFVAPAEVFARYVRLSSNSYFGLQEIQLWTTSHANVAPSAALSTAGMYSGYLTSIVDGISSNSSNAYDNMAALVGDEAWIELDLGSPVALDTLVLTPNYYASRGYTFYNPCSTITFMDVGRNTLAFTELPTVWTGVLSYQIGLQELVNPYISTTASSTPSGTALPTVTPSTTVTSNWNPAPVPTYNISTLVGDGSWGAYAGDGEPASNAKLAYPSGVAVTAAGDYYIDDFYHQVIRFVNSTTGIITTFAGNGQGYGNDPSQSGDGGPASSAKLNYPADIGLDAAGNLYISEQTQRIRFVSISTLVISCFAGTGTYGFSGDGESATHAQIWNPAGIAVDSSSGIVYFADSGNQRVRAVTAGIITTIVGTGEAGLSGDGGPATNATLWSPAGLAVARGMLYIADASNNRIRSVKLSTSIITTCAGSGVIGFNYYSFSSNSNWGDGQAAEFANLNNPKAVAVDAKGGLYISDNGHNAIRYVAADSQFIYTIAGKPPVSMMMSGSTQDGVVATTTTLSNPMGLGLNSAGDVIFADRYNERIRKLTAPIPSTSPTASMTSSGTLTSTASGSTTMTPSVSPTRTSTGTGTPAGTSTSTTSQTAAATRTGTGGVTQTSSMTHTGTSAATPSMTATSTSSGVPTPSTTGTGAVSKSHGASSSASSARTTTPAPSATPVSSGTATGTRTQSSTISSSRTGTATVTPSKTSVLTRTPTSTSSKTASSTKTRSPTSTSTKSSSHTSTSTRTPSLSTTLSATSSRSGTGSRTQTTTGTPSRTSTRTGTPSSTVSRSLTGTLTKTASSAVTRTPTTTHSACPIGVCGGAHT